MIFGSVQSTVDGPVDSYFFPWFVELHMSFVPLLSAVPLLLLLLLVLLLLRLCCFFLLLLLQHVVRCCVVRCCEH